MTDHANLAAALAAVQANMPTVHKGNRATVPTKAGGSYSYTYADLSDVSAAALPLLSANGLAWSCTPRSSERGWELVGVLLHTSGERLEGVLPLSGNTPQEWGSSITYMRRYLYMMALDICESDTIDANAGKPVPADTAPAPAAPKAPATPQQRQEVKEELTAPADNATTLQIKGLKSVLKKLKDSDPTKEELIAQIAVQTKGFTEISKSDCEALITRITAMLEGGNE